MVCDAVSYTHLDVYKRQDPRGIEADGNLDGDYSDHLRQSDFAAVSYTHLDVYKRQMMCLPLFPNSTCVSSKTRRGQICIG